MKIVFKVRGFGGGAPLSMLEYMKILKGKNEVVAMGSYYVNQNRYEEAGIQTVDMPAFKPPAVFGNLKASRRVKEFLLAYKPDLYVGWTSGEAVFGRLLCKKLGIPFLMMFTGGEVPSYFGKAVNFEPIFVFSEENKHDLILQGYDEKDIQVISNRMVFEKEISPAVRHYSKSKEYVELLMPTRVATTKWNSILKGIEIVEKANQRDIPTKLIIVGEGDRVDQLNELIREVNQKNKKTIVEYSGYVSNIIPCFEKADVVLGKARSVIEPICMGRVGLIVGEGRKVWISRKKGIENIYANNFSGRNMEKKATIEEILDMLEKIQKAEIDVQELKEVGEWIREKYDIHYAEDRIEAAFQQVVNGYRQDRQPKKFCYAWEYAKAYVYIFSYKARDLFMKNR